MSNNELFKIGSGQTWQQDYTLVAGLTPAGQQLTADFYLGTSRIVGLKLKTPNGVGAGSARVSQILGNNANAVGDQTARVFISSTAATDVSTYTLYWINETRPDSLY